MLELTFHHRLLRVPYSLLPHIQGKQHRKCYSEIQHAIVEEEIVINILISIPAQGPPGGFNESIIPSEIPDAEPFSAPQSLRVAACSPATSTPSDYWMNQMDHTGNPRGYAPFLANYYTYPVWRNVLDYGAKNDGSSDATPGIQAALNYYDGQNTRWSVGSKMAIPAHVFLPGGTYLLKSKLDLRVGTIIMGDPQNPPILKADPGFSGSVLVQGYDGVYFQAQPD